MIRLDRIDRGWIVHDLFHWAVCFIFIESVHVVAFALLSRIQVEVG